MIELRDYQRAAVDAIFDYWSRDVGKNGLVIAPTGSGKGVIISAFVTEVLKTWPDTRIMVITDSRELISQNEKAMRNYWKDAPTGIYSAGLGKRNTQARILFCGIQSVYKKAYSFEKTDIICIDECHMISPESTTRYQKFLGEMLVACPSMALVGFSATPYRMSTGVMYGNKGDLFDGIMYVCEMKKLIKDGWLVPLVSKAGISKIDLKGVKIQGGEYNSSDLAHAADSEILVPLAVNEIVECGKDRKAWLVFTSGIAHSEHVAKEMRKHGIDCEIVTGDTKSTERDRIVNKFKDGKLRCLINVAVFTKGFDAPRCDLIALLTSTRSTGKFVQICGRGMRPFFQKEDCMLLDFGSNVLLHGMIDEIDPIRTKNIFNVVKAPPPMRECEKCHAIFHAAIVKCPQCGYEKEAGPADPRHGAEAYSGPVLTSQQTPFIVDVKDFWVSRHKKSGKPDSLKVSFFDQMEKEFSMWLSLDSQSAYAAEKSRAIVKQFGGKATTVDAALLEHFNWRKVERIRVKPEGRFFRIDGFVFKKGEAMQQSLIDGDE